MESKPAHRKTVKHYHEPGDDHELTFSCYQRLPILTNDRWREHLARSIGGAAESENCELFTFVFMPEHVHLLVCPADAAADAKFISRFLAACKRPASAKIKADLQASGGRLLKRLTIRERPGKTVFRYWQEGPGYDRNLQTTEAILAAIEYIHLNPVRRGLCKRASDWTWSSGLWYETDGESVDPRLPRLSKPTAELFYGG